MVNTRELEEKLKNINEQIGTQLLTIKIQGEEKEYIIDSVTREKDYFEGVNSYHICLLAKECDTGCIKRKAVSF